MQWGVFFTTFCLIFLAELGDKTQLTTMVLAADSNAPSLVFIGAALALVASALLGVVFGEAITRVVPEQTIHVAAGAMFVVLGLILIIRR